jgi:hypothetical protein
MVKKCHIIDILCIMRFYRVSNILINTYVRIVKNAIILTKKKITIRDIQRVVYMTCFLPKGKIKNCEVSLR